MKGIENGVRGYNVFFTADLHLFHKKIIELAKRPYDDLDHMHEDFVDGWNERVTDEDEVHILGDVSFGKIEQTVDILRSLKGHLHLIKGGHDKFDRRAKDRALWYGCFDSVCPINEIKVFDNERKDYQRITLCHYAMKVWNLSHHGAWMLYGHSHGSMADDPHAFSMDVGVDACGYRPISFEAVKRFMSLKTFKPVDHHGAAHA